MTRPKALLLVALLALGPLTLLGPTASAQVTPRWWDPPEVRGPDDYRHGWNLRVPLRVDNPFTYPIGTDHPLIVHLHANHLAAEAGWVGGTVAGLPTPRSFTFSNHSVRLVEYGPNWGMGAGLVEVAATVHHTWLERDQQARYGRVQVMDFDPDSGNSVVTLVWLPREPIPPGGRAYYYAYFEAQENSDKPPAEYPDLARERLDGVSWVGRGTELWGHVTGSTTGARNLEITATQPGTVVKILEYRPGFPRPTLLSLSGQPNPFTLEAAGDRREFLILPPDRALKIQANQPVLAAERRGDRATDFIPSLDANHLGTRFQFTPREDSSLFLLADAPRDTQVTLQRGGDTEVVAIPRDPGFLQVSVVAGATVRIESPDHPILVQPQPRSGTAVLAQAPSIDTGSPHGRSFYAATTFAGRVRFAAPDEASHPRLFESLFASQAIYPAPGTATQLLMPGDCQSVRPAVPYFPEGMEEYSLPLFAFSNLHDASLPTDERGRFAYFTGGPSVTGTCPANVRHSTPIGGAGATRFLAWGPLILFGHHNATNVWVNGERLLLDRDGLLPVGALSQRSEIVSDKPIVVVPVTAANLLLTRYFAGRLPDVPVAILQPEFRGFMVGLRSPDGVSPIFTTARPGQTVSVPLLVQNLGRWSGGVTLIDTIRVAASGPAVMDGAFHWMDSGTPTTQATLDGGTARPLELLLTAPSQLASGTSALINITATSTKNPNMADRIQILLLVEESFDVRLFWKVGGSTDVKSLDREMPVSSVRYVPFVVENRGTGTDSYRLGEGTPSLGWGVRVVATPHSGAERVTRVDDVAPGERRELFVEVTAPETSDQRTFTAYILQATSLSHPATGDLIKATFRLDLRREVAVETPDAFRSVAPGETTLFPLLLVNRGEDVLSLRVTLPEPPPAGWTAELTGLPPGPGGFEVSLEPGQSIPFGLLVTAPAGARLGQFAAFLVEAATFGAQAPARGGGALVATVERHIDFTAVLPARFDATADVVLRLPVDIVHAGNADAVYALRPEVLPAGWRPQDLPTLSLAASPTPGGTTNGTLTLNVTIPQAARSGDYPVVLRLVHRDGGHVDLATRVTVVRHTDQAVEVPREPVLLGPQEPAAIHVVLRNLGNAPTTLRAEVTAPPGWQAQADPSLLSIEPKRNGTLTLRVSAPPDAPQGRYALDLRVRTPEGDTLSMARIDLDLAYPDIALTEPTLLGAPARRAGDVVFFAVPVTNLGPVAALDVPVDLIVDDLVVDSVVLERLRPGSTALVTLQMVWPGAVDRIAVEANREGTVPEPDLSSNRAAVPLDLVEAPGIAGVPSPAWLAALAAALVAFLLHVASSRRRAR